MGLLSFRPISTDRPSGDLNRDGVRCVAVAPPESRSVAQPTANNKPISETAITGDMAFLMSRTFMRTSSYPKQRRVPSKKCECLSASVCGHYRVLLMATFAADSEKNKTVLVTDIPTASISLTPRFSGVWALAVLPKPFQRFYHHATSAHTVPRATLTPLRRSSCGMQRHERGVGG